MVGGRLKGPRLSGASVVGESLQNGKLESLRNTDSWAPSPQVPIQLVLGRAHESAFLTSSQGILVHGPHFEEH